MSAAAFYAESHWRNGWDPAGPDAHSGLDIGGHPLGEEIPLVRAGRLVASGYDSYYGFFATFDVGDHYDIYCHMLTKSKMKIGTDYARGNTVGQVGNSGLWSNGRHLHYMICDGTSPHSRPTYDPAPIVRRLFPKPPTSGGAGTVTEPITPEPAPIPEEFEMRLALDPTQKKLDRTNLYWVVGNGAPKRFTGDQAAANEFVKKYATGLTYQPTVAEWPSFLDAFTPGATPATITDAQLAKISAGVKVDLSSVVAAMLEGFSGISAALKALPGAVAEAVIAGFRTIWSK